MSKNCTSETSMDDEYPEITQGDLDRSVFRVDLQPTAKKERITIMLDAGIIAWFKAQAGERGYQTMINEALRKIIEYDGLEKQLRRIVREEIDQAMHAH